MPVTAEQQAKLDTLCRLLLQENTVHNLTRITDPQEVQTKHFADSLVALPHIQEYAQNHAQELAPRLIDIGSGAGFPWLVLAVMLDDFKFTSVEATGKKVAFQEKAAAELGLKNYQVINARAEELGHEHGFRENYDIATARALGPLAMVTELAIPLLKCKGFLLAWKGPKVIEELPAGKEAARKVGAKTPEIIPYQLPGMNQQDSALCLVKITKSTPTPKNYPRTFNLIKKDCKE